ncbi:uncharacterized protein LOC127876170 isoform X2 [Dreissena polymorpha]|uniref:uncharacterized protein LOC127876170 isoform X2 n=1 Tax=Dreissena polymorpha TaxID=45954 RepID=UPI002264C670|nr:uncharacterized protein LOC127876170 isoform X2 [Dreissena polymorpha]
MDPTAVMQDGADLSLLQGDPSYQAGSVPVDQDGAGHRFFLILATENLHCIKCKKNQIGWSDAILDQLDPATRSLFPVQMMYHSACDNRVIYLLRQRGLGNSPTQLQKQSTELHNLRWTKQELQYMSDCALYCKSVQSRLILTTFEEPPPHYPLPTYQWFLPVYQQEVLSRSEEVKAAVTSIFGRVLKMDSTKKKLAGKAARTAAWSTYLGNEYGQVLMSAITAIEGCGLEEMVSGILRHYSEADVLPPVLLYVDSNCCGKSALMEIFRSAWPHFVVGLDVWHFMQRLAVGVTTDTHRLYATFMGQLSAAIFQWDRTDLNLLKSAKREELIHSNIQNPSDSDIQARLDRKELSLHCCRMTRSTEVIRERIQAVLELFDGDSGRDTMGVPLLHHERIWELWKQQQKHVECLQDPKGVQLYTQTGTLKKGGVVLPVYRCARGSTSLESFHLQLQRFIPGTSASASNFQTYLLEGLMHWNEDRQIAATSTEKETVLYDARLKTPTNRLSQKLFNKNIFPTFQPPNKYTGELIGIEYLYSQTGKSLGAQDPVVETEPDASLLDEGFEDPAAMDDDDPTIQIEDSFLSALSRERARHIMQQNRPSQSELSGNAMDAEQTKKVVQRKSPA